MYSAGCKSRRKIREQLECQKMGWRPHFFLEAFYKPAQEGIDVTFDEWRTEVQLLGRGDNGAWQISVETYLLMELPGDPSAFFGGVRARSRRVRLRRHSAQRY